MCQQGEFRIFRNRKIQTSEFPHPFTDAGIRIVLTYSEESLYTRNLCQPCLTGRVRDSDQGGTAESSPPIMSRPRLLFDVVWAGIALRN
jgi:hypothetical protein